MKSIPEKRSPIQKLKTIVKAAEQITVSIEEFYKEINQTNTKKLDGDQTLSIFMYCVAKSDLKHLGPHIKIIEKFSTNNILNSVSGYYATTLEACFACISTMNFSDEMTALDLCRSVKELLHSITSVDEVKNIRAMSISQTGKSKD